MLESILVGVIIVAAAAFVFYRLVIRRSCGCGDDCGCSPEKKNGCGCGTSGKKTK